MRHKQKRVHNIHETFGVRAVDWEGSILGFVRMKAQGKLPEAAGETMIQGICGLFQKDAEGNLFFDRDSLFFCGDVGEFRGHYRNLSPPETFKVEDYTSPSSTGERVEFYTHVEIPLDLERLEFSKAQKTLVGRLLQDAERVLPGLVDGVERIEIDPQDVTSNRRFGQYFGSFPRALRSIALENGVYYSGRSTKFQQKTVTVDQPVEQVRKVIHIPSGGLPDWTRDWMRHHRH